MMQLHSLTLGQLRLPLSFDYRQPSGTPASSDHPLALYAFTEDPKTKDNS